MASLRGFNDNEELMRTEQKLTEQLTSLRVNYEKEVKDVYARLQACRRELVRDTA